MGAYERFTPVIHRDELTAPELDLIQNLVGLSYQAGDLLYWNGSDLVVLHVGTNGQVLTLSGGLPVWSNDTTSGTVTSVSVLTANGVSAVVTNPTTTPAITVVLGDISPSSVTSSGVVRPSADDGAALGASGQAWSDLFLASGSIINFNGGDVTITHSANALDIDGGVVDFGSVPTVNGSAIARAADKLSFFASTTSAELAGVISNETGSGLLVFNDTPTLIAPLLGTPTSGTLTNCTGLPIATGVANLAANVATFLTTPSSANLIAAVTDETGTGALVFADTPTLVTPVIGAATGTSLVLTGLLKAETLQIEDSDATHYLVIKTTSNLTADRDFTIVTGDAARSLTLAGNLNIAADFITSGANSLTLTTAGATNVTLPTTGTLATLAGAETLSGKTLTAPKFANGGFIADANGNELIIFTTTGSAVNEITIANGATGVGPTFTASGETNVDINFQIKGTGVYNFKATTSGPADLRLFEDTDNGTSYVSLIAPASLSSSFVLTLPAATDTLVGKATTDTLTNKRVTPRVSSETSSATPTINTDNVDAHSITALAATVTSMTTNLSGTPTNFQKLIVRFKDDGTARGITWGASFEAKGVALPTTTVISKVLTVGFIYDTVTSKWGCVASAQEA